MIAVYIIFSTGGALMMKAGAANPLSLSVADGRLGVSVGWVTVAGLGLYLVSFILWMRLVQTNDISWFFPLAAGAIQVLMITGAIVFFKEPVEAMRLIGAAIVICGIIVMNIKVKA